MRNILGTGILLLEQALVMVGNRCLSELHVLYELLNSSWSCIVPTQPVSRSAPLPVLFNHEKCSTKFGL